MISDVPIEEACYNEDSEYSVMTYDCLHLLEAKANVQAARGRLAGQAERHLVSVMERLLTRNRGPDQALRIFNLADPPQCLHNLCHHPPAFTPRRFLIYLPCIHTLTLLKL